MPTNTHLSSENLTAYRLGQLPLEKIAEVEAHLTECGACRGQFDQAASQDPAAPPTVSYAASELPPSVAGHEIRRELARGGLGVVYLAYHPRLLDYRAIKRPLLRPGLDRDAVLARFRREVQAIGSLRNDHIVRAHDADDDAAGPYLVLEYLDGKPLNALTRPRGPLAYPLACELIRQAALGLQAGHERELVHRDVKPSNLMLARVNSGSARVVVIDWGLVRFVGDEPTVVGLAPAHTILGTPDYMAPEQIRDVHGVDTRADIYSLGITLFFLLAGKAPFQGRGEREKLAAQENESLPPLAGLPAEVTAVLQKMVEKDPARRYATPGDVARALQPFCCSPDQLVRLLDGAETSSVSRARRRLIWPIAAVTAGILLFLLVGTLGVWMLVRRSGADQNQDNPEGKTPGILGKGPATPTPLSDLHAGLCTSLAFLPDGIHAVSEDGGNLLVIWDLQKRRQKATVEHGLGKSLSGLAGLAAPSPDGKYLAAAGVNPGPGTINLLRLFDQKTYRSTDEAFVFNPRSLGKAIAFSPDGGHLAIVELPAAFERIVQPLLGSAKITIAVVELGKRSWRKFPVAATVHALAFSPNGKLLASCGDDDQLTLWDLHASRKERAIPAHPNGADQVAFSADGTELYSASSADDTLRVWSLVHENKEVLKIPIGKTLEKMTCCAFWSRGLALTGHVDGNVVLWDLRAGAERKRFTHPGARITAIAISPDGHHALAAHADRRLVLYRLPTP